MRAPDRIIGTEEDPYLYRWFIIPRNRWFNIYLHKFLRSDDDRALHDHPWVSCSVLLKGCYREHMQGGGVKLRRPFRPWAPWRLIFRRPSAAHRVELLAERDAPVWTLFITGPRVREWGFLCPQGWRHWTVFTDQTTHGNTIGKGCDP